MHTTDAVQVFLNSRHSKGLSSETIRWYRGILIRFINNCPNLPCNPEKIEDFLISCPSGDERKHGYYRTLRCFYRFLNRRFNIPNPIDLVEAPKRSKKQPRFLMPNDLNRLLSYQHSPQIKAALLFLVDTGARLGELSRLSIDMINETPSGFIATIKGKTGTRNVPVSYEAYHALMINLPFTYKKHRLGRLIARAFNNAGVKGTAHTLRHTFGTLWRGDQFALKDIMGHSKISTTELYRHLRFDFLLEQHSRYSPLKMVLSSSKSML